MGSHLWRHLFCTWMGPSQKGKALTMNKLKISSGTAIVVSSPRMAKECFEQNGATTSDRPSLHVVNLVYNGLEMPLARYGRKLLLIRSEKKTLINHEC